MRASGALTDLLRHKRWPEHAAMAEQVHGTRLVVVPKLKRPKIYAGADGLLSAEADQPLAIFTADCLPVFLDVSKKGVVGLLHAGWRGVQGRILGKAVTKILQLWGCRPADIRIWFGPAIGPCCFKVRWDVARYFPQSRRRRKDCWTVDLAKQVRLQAAGMGIKVLEGNPPCTMHGRKWFSYRREATDQRQVSLIMRRI
jgi:YfiH family protein